MKPDDSNGKLPASQRPLRILVIAGSNRRQYNCPGVDSKARALMLGLADRLVCMNGGNPREELIEHKNPKLAMKLEHEERWRELSQNHLEGRTAGFFCYGDGGGDELDGEGRGGILRHPKYFDLARDPFDEMREAYAPLVWQCRYGGIEVPDQSWTYTEFGKNKKYSDNQAEHMAGEGHVYRDVDAWADRFVGFVAEKGKVNPGTYRAYGHEPPGKLWEEAKLQWRSIRVRTGRAPEGSSPAAQEGRDLNRDATLRPQESEGEKLRGGKS